MNQNVNEQQALLRQEIRERQFERDRAFKNESLVNKILFLCDFLCSSSNDNGIAVRVHPGIYWINNNNSYSVLTTKKFNIFYNAGHGFFDKKLKPFKLYYGEKEYHD